MKKFTTLLFLIAASGLFTALSAQTFMDYIDEMRGEDTAVVKSFVDMDNQSNSLIDAIASDTLATGERANPNRVYVLKRGHFYVQDKAYRTPIQHPLTIMGEEGPLVGGTMDDSPPAEIHGTTRSDGSAQNGGFLQPLNDLTIKNVGHATAADNGAQGWTFFTVRSSGIQLSFDNCLFEHTNWVFLQSNFADSTKVRFENSYFVNMNGFPCRRNGGVYDNVNYNTSEIYVENCTHVMAGGMMYKFRNYPVNSAYFNHNTFVNCTGLIFETFGNQVSWSVTNNLFVNSNCQAYYPGLDLAETDQDSLPTGIINANVLKGMDTWYPDGFDEADRAILVDRNAVYWDSRLDDIITDLQAKSDTVTWLSQMITMNSRTQDMFDDDETYPLLYEDNWIMGEDPGFVDMDDQVPNIINYCMNTPYEDSNTNLTKWRAAGNEITDENIDNYVYFDWPLNCDLKYSNSTLTTAGLSGFPVGDLNWFASLKSTWDLQADAEHASIMEALETGTEPVAQEISGIKRVSSGVNLQMKNYPNPFIDHTTISYSIPSNGDVSLVVYDIQGKRVATLVDKQQYAGEYSVEFTNDNLAPGLYSYSLRFNGARKTMKMLVK